MLAQLILMKIRNTRVFLVFLFLTAFIFFFGVATCVWAQDAEKVCQETKKIKDDLIAEHKEVASVVNIRNRLKFYNDYLSELSNGIRDGYVISGLQKLVNELSYDTGIIKEIGSLSVSPKERLEYQKKLFPLFKKLVDKASEVKDIDALTDQMERLDAQISLREQRLKDLKCDEVLSRPSVKVQNLVGLWRDDDTGSVYEFSSEGTAVYREVSPSSARYGHTNGSGFLSGIRVIGNGFEAMMTIRALKVTCPTLGPTQVKGVIKGQADGNTLSLTAPSMEYSTGEPCKWTGNVYGTLNFSITRVK